MLADLALGVAEGPTPASTLTPDAAEEAPPSPAATAAESAGPSPSGSPVAPTSTSAAASLPVADDSDAVKDAAGQYLPPVGIRLFAAASACLSEAVSHAAAVRMLSMPPCHLVMCTKCLLQVGNKRDVVLAAFCV